MGRLFQGVDGLTNCGNVPGLAFQVDVQWSALVFLRLLGDADNGVLWAKWGTSGIERRFRVRVRDTDRRIEIHATNNRRILMGLGLVLGEDYLICICEDGLENNDSLRCQILEMDGTVYEEQSNRQFANSDDVTTDLALGARMDLQDPLHGILTHACYVDTLLTDADFQAYLKDPVRMARKWRHQYGVRLWLPFPGIGTMEPDWSGGMNTGTVTGGTTQGPNPPARLQLTMEAPRMYYTAGAPPTFQIPWALGGRRVVGVG